MIPIGAAQSMATMQAETLSPRTTDRPQRDAVGPRSPLHCRRRPLPAYAVALSGLTKIYRGRGDGRRGPAKPALDKVDLTIPRRGAPLRPGSAPMALARSTLINILAGPRAQDRGTGGDLGYRHRCAGRARRGAAIGVVPQELNIDPFLHARASLLDLHGRALTAVPKARAQRRPRSSKAVRPRPNKADFL